MKQKPLIITIISIAAFVVGCKPAGEQPAVSDVTNAPVQSQLDQVKKEAKETVTATKDYAYAQKAQFAQSIREQLADLNKKMDELSAKVETSSDATKAEAKEKLAAMREKANHLNEQLDQLKDTTETKWDETKAGIQKGWDELKNSFDQARQWLADKIAPGTPPPNN